MGSLEVMVRIGTPVLNCEVRKQCWINSWHSCCCIPPPLPLVQVGPEEAQPHPLPLLPADVPVRHSSSLSTQISFTASSTSAVNLQSESCSTNREHGKDFTLEETRILMELFC